MKDFCAVDALLASMRWWREKMTVRGNFGLLIGSPSKSNVVSGDSELDYEI